MSKKAVSAVIFMLLLTSMLTLAFNIQPAKASGTVGVKAGDWIKCTYTVSGWPSGTPYPEWLKVEFLSVEGTNATIRVTMRMSDETEQSDTMTVDVAAGGGTFQGLSGFVIPANCTTGESIYMTEYGNVTIAGETTGTYAGATRTVVYASFAQYGTQLTYYWDKQTGVMVEASVTSGNMTGTAKATETNIWQAQPIPTSISVYPFEITVPMDEIFTINVTVANVTDLYVWQINLHFDPSILNCTGAWYPDDHVFAGKDIVLVTPVIDNVGGYILYGCCLLGEEETFNGSGTLCQIQFKAVLPGNSTLACAPPWPDTFLQDFDLNEIPYITYEGYVMVARALSSLFGDLNNDSKVDIRDVIVVARAFGSSPNGPRWNIQADVNQDGKVGIRDVALVAKQFGQHYP